MFPKVKIGYRAFCEETSIHGFVELYRAKYYVWKFVWFVLLFSAFAVTGFQLYGSVGQYVNQSTIKTVESATEDDIVYPPLKYCIAHWLLWLDNIELVQSMNRSALIYALSYLTLTKSEIWFNVTEAKNELKAYLQRKNYTLEMFYTQNARMVNAVSVEQQHDDAFPDKELSYFNNNIYMCYVLNDIKSRLSSSKQITIEIDQENDLINLLHGDDFIMTKNDLFETMFRFCDIRELFKCWKLDATSNEFLNESVSATDYYQLVTRFKYRPTEYLVLDGYNYNKNIKLSHKGSEYSSQIKLSIQKLLPNDANKCNGNSKTVFQKEACDDKCRLISYSSYYYHENKSLATPCKDLRTLILFGEKDYGIDDVCGKPINGIDDYVPGQKENVYDIDEEIYRNCMKECNGGCEKLDWEIFSSITQFGNNDSASTVINIQYPTIGSVIVFRESDPKTWQDFVGNVGGLLGIWTGASVLSLFQLIYLFCCPPELQTKDSLIKITTKRFKLNV